VLQVQQQQLDVPHHQQQQHWLAGQMQLEVLLLHCLESLLSSMSQICLLVLVGVLVVQPMHVRLQRVQLACCLMCSRQCSCSEGLGVGLLAVLLHLTRMDRHCWQELGHT
jgi:hypothetical protein